MYVVLLDLINSILIYIHLYWSILVYINLLDLYYYILVYISIYLINTNQHYVATLYFLDQTARIFGSRLCGGDLSLELMRGQSVSTECLTDYPINGGRYSIPMGGFTSPYDTFPIKQWIFMIWFTWNLDELCGLSQCFSCLSLFFPHNKGLMQLFHPSQPIEPIARFKNRGSEFDTNDFYCGWKKSCTTLDGWTLITYKYSVNNWINHLSTGAGFLPSTVVPHTSKPKNTNYHYMYTSFDNYWLGITNFTKDAEGNVLKDEPRPKQRTENAPRLASMWEGRGTAAEKTGVIYLHILIICYTYIQHNSTS